MKKKRKILIILAILAVAAAVLAIFVKSYIPAEIWFADKINRIEPDKNHYVMYYQDNVLCDVGVEPSYFNHDVQEIQVGNNKKYLINHARGFALEFPRDAEFDFSLAADYISAKSADMDIVVSKEYTIYNEGDKTRGYVEEYINKYLLADKFIENNKITLHKNAVEYIHKNWVQIVAFTRQPAPDSKVKYNTYVYCYVYTGSPKFYRIMFKAAEYDDKLIEQVYRTLYSFEDNLPVKGEAKNFTNYAPKVPEFWSDETKAFYESLVGGDSIKWGIYEPLNVRNADMSGILELEKKLDYRFDGVLEYLYFGEELPVEGMQKAYEDGKTIELTIQTSTVMNENLDGYNPVFDILDGKRDDEIYYLANRIKEYGHPILFRLNNEMNSDWTSYGVSACLNDPDIYVQLWRKFYDMFRDSGVNNTIWVFNPNDESYPPHGYNATMAFYPGDEYVQVFGVTGYNTGTYYAQQNNEKWKTFDDIYGKIYDRHHETYKNFPWIITEFASSSIGGDKVKWINDMFRDIKKYPNIRMAFWFNSADYDLSYGKDVMPARPYWLDENEDTLAAFKKGLAKK